ncbi:MAG: calcium-binding protein, partial [Coleofasciculus sp.]
SGNDTIYANEGVNIIDAGDGDNLIYSGSGNDTITTGSGDDTIYAGEGVNTISTGYGNDIIYSGSGDDLINAGRGQNQIWLGGGQNTISLEMWGSSEINNFNPYQDQLDLGLSDLRGVVLIGQGNDTMIGLGNYAIMATLQNVDVQTVAAHSTDIFGTELTVFSS